MQLSGKIIVRGVVQGVGFRPFVYAAAHRLGISGCVQNLGSEVEIKAAGAKFEEFINIVREGPPLSQIDSLEISPLDEEIPVGFSILPSRSGTLSGMIPPDVATCTPCLHDMDEPGGRYEKYWATSCVNCGPRYSIIRQLPYDRERTSMAPFQMCGGCLAEYQDPVSRRHHAQTIACPGCGPVLTLLDPEGNMIEGDPVKTSAMLLDQGNILAIRGIGGFHLSCIEDAAGELKRRLGRVEQPFAVMVRPDHLDQIACVSPTEWDALKSPERPIMVLEKRDASAHAMISNLHTIGCMLPYTGLHHLIFKHLTHPLIVMTSANMPGYPMIIEIDHAMAKMHENADFYLTHNREIVNRCDDSVMRNGYIIRLSRGIAPKRTRIGLGDQCILGVGPELNSNTSIYKDGFCTTSPHVGNVRNPQTFAYLQETVERLGRLLGARYEVIAHDAHPRFLSTRYATTLAEESGARLTPVQHHMAHIAAATREECIGIAIDGVGYGDDGSIWGGEIFAGTPPHLERVGHVETVPMPGGDLATRFPERMLYGILPEPAVLELLSERGWTDLEIGVLRRQLSTGVNVAMTSSTGRVLDAVSAMLGVCRERTYDGEPAMKLESFARSGRIGEWPLVFSKKDGRDVLSTPELCREACSRAGRITADGHDLQRRRDIAASFQYNLARGIAAIAVRAADERGIKPIALSGGVAYNEMIRETILYEITRSGHTSIINNEYPLGDGCISFGQCVWAGLLGME